MTDRMTSTSGRVEIITSVQRGRRWTAAEKMQLVEQMQSPPQQRARRPPAPADGLVAKIQTVIADLLTYCYRREHAILRRRTDSRRPPASEP